MSDLVVVAIITAVPSVVAAVCTLINQKKLREIHIDLNGRLTELLVSTGAASHAEGKVEGITQEQARKNAEVSAYHGPG